jgi:signal peptidase
MNKKAILVLLLMISIAPLVAFIAPQTVGADHSYVVLTSSMSPTVHAGDVVFVSEVNPTKIEKGDIITFDPERGPLSEQNELITHRVVDVKEKSNKLHFVTKGDANDSPDPVSVAADNVIGRMTFQLPLIGHIIAFAGSRLGMLLLIVIPAGLLGVLEIRDLLEQASEDGSTAGK